MYIMILLDDLFLKLIFIRVQWTVQY